MSMSINAYLKDINLHLSEDMEPHLKPKFLPKLYLRFQIIDNELFGPRSAALRSA